MSYDMDVISGYQQWSAKDVEHHVLEAAETLMKLPNDFRGGANSLWNEYVDGYGRGRTKVIVRPTGDQIDRMYLVWGWVNALPEQADRELLYSWAWVKVRRGRSINDFASREGMNVRTLRRAVTRVCQQIANNLNRLYRARLTTMIDPVSQNLVYEEADRLDAVAAEAKHSNYWRQAGAVPSHLPKHPDHIALIERLQAKAKE